MATSLSDPPRGWQAMLELLAVRGLEPPTADESGGKEGFFSKLAGLVFSSPISRARVRGEADLALLGLATVQSAEERYRAASDVPELVGPTVVKGERHGRAVELRIDPDRYRTRVDAAVPEFHVRSERGQLKASERSPAEVHGALAGLTRDSRWEGVEVKGGPDGIAVFHRVEGRSGGTQGYLDDLWLAERLADLLGSSAPTAAP